MLLKYFGFFTLILLSCMNQSVQYGYADGSANRYIITPDQLEYIPVRPEESSTGMYSGGEPKKVSLTKDQFEKISSLLERALQTTEAHMEDRMKTSGLVEKIVGNERKSCILKPKSEPLVEIEKALKELLAQ